MMIPEKKKILFVCVENSNRSQMAQAFANKHGEEVVEAFSAGSRPSGKLNPMAIYSMKELGYDMTPHHSKSVNELPDEEFEYVISMGCGDECPHVPAKHRIEWDIPDPRNMSMRDFKEVRDLIEEKVKELVEQITKKAKK